MAETGNNDLIITSYTFCNVFIITLLLPIITLITHYSEYCR